MQKLGVLSGGQHCGSAQKCARVFKSTPLWRLRRRQYRRRDQSIEKSKPFLGFRDCSAPHSSYSVPLKCAMSDQHYHRHSHLMGDSLPYPSQETGFLFLATHILTHMNVFVSCLDPRSSLCGRRNNRTVTETHTHMKVFSTTLQWRNPI